jgi:hypothetical protein
MYNKYSRLMEIHRQQEATAAEAQEEVPAKAGLVDIANILGTSTVTIVRSSL